MNHPIDEQIFVATDDEAGMRADMALAARVPDLSRALVRKLFDAGLVRVDGTVARPARRLKVGERIEARLDIPRSLTAEPEEIPLRVVYQDDDLAVIDKPPGLAVHPSPGRPSGTLANALVARFSAAAGVGPPSRPGIVHRLDMDTSGLLVVALSPQSQASLQKQIAERSMRREYLALVTGHIEPPAGTIDAPVGRDPVSRTRMAVHGMAARSARTSYQTLETLPGATLLRIRLHTGRTHQIRVHMASIGHPIVGDRLYHGASVPGLERQFLHAGRLEFRSPTTGEVLSFESLLPADLQAVLDRLRGEL